LFGRAADRGAGMSTRWRRPLGFGVLVALTATGTRVAVATTAAGGHAREVATQTRDDTVGARQPARQFLHTKHEQIDCRRCHGEGAQHRTYLVKTARDCASCHHAADQPVACTTCHAIDSLPAVRQVQTPMRLPPTEAPRPRVLAFRHALHLTARDAVPCRTCHTGDVLLAVERPCASCHESHHRPEAECRSCHLEPALGAHTAAVHLGCAGAGCHQAARVPPLGPTRQVCLACHSDKRDHEVDGLCAECHRIPFQGQRPGSDASRGSRWAQGVVR